MITLMGSTSGQSFFPSSLDQFLVGEGIAIISTSLHPKMLRLIILNILEPSDIFGRGHPI